MDNNSSTDWRWVGDGFGMIQAHHMYRALYFCYYDGSSTLDDSLGLGGGKALCGPYPGFALYTFFCTGWCVYANTLCMPEHSCITLQPC